MSEQRREELLAMDQEEIVNMVLLLEAALADALTKKVKAPKINNVEYVLADELPDSAAKLPPQAKTIVAWIQGEEGKVTEAKLREIASERAAELKTKQDPWRIFAYYRPRMIEEGILRQQAV